MSERFEQVLIRNCRFAFRCHQRWDLLEQTPNARIRYCHECGQDVVLCRRDDELRAALRANQCVAVVPEDQSVTIATVGMALDPMRPWGE